MMARAKRIYILINNQVILLFSPQSFLKEILLHSTTTTATTILLFSPLLLLLLLLLFCHHIGIHIKRDTGEFVPFELRELLLTLPFRQSRELLKSDMKKIYTPNHKLQYSIVLSPYRNPYKARHGRICAI